MNKLFKFSLAGALLVCSLAAPALAARICYPGTNCDLCCFTQLSECVDNADGIIALERGCNSLYYSCMDTCGIPDVPHN